MIIRNMNSLWLSDAWKVSWLESWYVPVFYRPALLWMENTTMVTPLKQPIVFELEGFYMPPGYNPFLFFLALFNYMVVLMGNGIVAIVIVIDKATAMLPCLMINFFTRERRIAYIPAIAQAMCKHMVLQNRLFWMQWPMAGIKNIIKGPFWFFSPQFASAL